MLVYYFVEIDRPFEEAEPILLRLLEGASDAADIAYREGEALRAQIGFGQPRIHKTVELRLGQALRGENQTSIPLAWEATGPTRIFPSMTADLTLARLGPRISHLALSGAYEPPLGALGKAVDRLTLHRLAEATVKRFTDRIASAVYAWPQGVTT